MQNLEKRQSPQVERMPQASRLRTVAPAVDIYEGAEETWLVADLPGVKKDDLHVEVDNEELRLRAQAHPFSDESATFEFSRAFRIPPGIDPQAVRADLKDGVLTLKLPKPEEKKPRKIDVHVA